MEAMLSRIKDYIKTYQMISEGDHVLAAVSGGADSVFLLLMLRELSSEGWFSLSAVHIEHGIRGESSRADAAFVKQLCEEKKIPCRVVAVKAPAFAKQEGIGIEEAARALRYQALNEAAERMSCGKIAVAHHMDDNAETMLFHLARGTGLSGLAGIPPVRERIIRPLLCVSRDEIERWLGENNAAWRTDETNADVSYSRNRIRAQVLPGLKEINPMAAVHMAELSKLLRQTMSCLDREADKAFCSLTGLAKGTLRDQTDVCPERVALPASELVGLEPALADHLLYRLLQKMAGSTRDMTHAHVQSVRSLCGKGVGKQVCLPYGLVAERDYEEIVVRREAGGQCGRKTALHGTAKEPDAVPEACLLKVPGTVSYDGRWQVRARLFAFDGDMEKIPRNPYTKWFDYDKISNSMQIRPRETGDYLQIDRRGGHKSIQDYMVEEKVPFRARGRVPLIADGNHIIWVVGRRISEAYKITPQTKKILELHISEEKE